MIQHTVAFTLRHATGSPQEKAFIADAKRILTPIASVLRFEQFRQVSPKSSYAFGFSFQFADQAGYDTYNNHPDHIAFVRDRWMREVADFLELDYVSI